MVFSKKNIFNGRLGPAGTCFLEQVENVVVFKDYAEVMVGCTITSKKVKVRRGLEVATTKSCGEIG